MRICMRVTLVFGITRVCTFPPLCYTHYCAYAWRVLCFVACILFCVFTHNVCARCESCVSFVLAVALPEVCVRIPLPCVAPRAFLLLVLYALCVFVVCVACCVACV